MTMDNSIKWISGANKVNTECPVFKKSFEVGEGLVSAVLNITAQGVYEAKINGKRVGEFILAPGFTSYGTRLQYQSYDITNMLKDENEIEVGTANGWYCGILTWMSFKGIWGKQPKLAAEIVLTYKDRTETIETDSTWLVAEGNVISSEIYMGEEYDASKEVIFKENAVETVDSNVNIIPQEGEEVQEQERIKPVAKFRDNNGNLIVDFGQNLTGYVEFTVDAKKGDIVEYDHGEIIDKDGNFYNENLRTAKQHIKYICRDGVQTYKPHFTFMGFRYICVRNAPENIDFTSIAVYSKMKRTGSFKCGNSKINQLYSNIIWGQRSNFLDIPTDCPQRDERLGWTGDAQVFIKTASYNYDVEKFFVKWLADLRADQHENGSVPHVIPDMLENNDGSAAWGDASVICPWQLYMTYGNKKILSDSFESMRKWIEFSKNPIRMHFGDWLAKDDNECQEQEIFVVTPEDPLKGHSSQRLISDAFNLYTTSLFIKSGEILGKDMSEYKEVYKKRLNDFQSRYEYHTQTECALALFFNIAKDKAATAKKLAELVIKNGKRLSTGFVGTPYLLHALSQNGYTELAYDLLLQEKYPSWLFSVNRGATTIWEHWDGIREDGSITDVGMNSYNHYAYGAVADWMYEVVCGIHTDENKPAFENVILEPVVDKRLGNAEAVIETRFGRLLSSWSINGSKAEYVFEVPNKAEIRLHGDVFNVDKGIYKYSYEI